MNAIRYGEGGLGIENSRPFSFSAILNYSKSRPLVRGEIKRKMRKSFF